MRFLLVVPILIFGLLAGLPSRAQSSGKVSEGKATKKSTMKTKPRLATPRSSQLHLRMSGIIWQEALKISNGASRGTMETQSQGLVATLIYLRPTGSRAWYQYYGLDMGFGAIKGKGNTVALADELKGQMWVLAGLSPGVLYRTSPVASLGLALPLIYRRINWQLKDGSTFNPEGDSSFSFGVTGMYMNSISKQSQLYLAVTHQTNWVATSWAIGYQYRFF